MRPLPSTRLLSMARGAAIVATGAVLVIVGAACSSATPTNQEEQPEGMSKRAWGEQLYYAKGCATCHDLGNRRRTGPPLGRLAWGDPVALEQGEAVFDEAYVRESILAPGAKLASGYLPNMPSYENILNEAQVDALVAFLRDHTSDP